MFCQAAWLLTRGIAAQAFSKVRLVDDIPDKELELNAHTEYGEGLCAQSVPWDWPMEVDRIQGMIMQNYGRLRGVFQYCCIMGSVGANNPWTMGMRQYENFIKASKIKVRRCAHGLE